MDTVNVYGVKLLKCFRDDCSWNIGYTPRDLNRSGLEFTYRAGAGIRVCNFGCKALAYGKDIPGDCPHKLELCQLLGEDDMSFEHRFWGRIEPEVAQRALGVDPAQN
jgi:hypothetical protein